MKRLFPVAVLMGGMMVGSAAVSPVGASSPLVFNGVAPTNDLKGTLAAEVLFAQSHVIRARPVEGDTQPHLVGLRKSLVMVRPLRPDAVTPMVLVVRSSSGQVLGTLNLNPPRLLPKTAYFVDGAPEDLDFKPRGSAAATIRGKSELEKLSDPSGAGLLSELRRNAVVQIETADGQWVRDIHVPSGKGLDGKMVRVRSEAGYESTVHYSGRSVQVSRGQVVVLKCANGQWFREGELENNGIVYASDAWSGVLPAEWVVPGISLQIRQGTVSGDLAGLRVGAPTQLLIYTIDVGMLTPPRGAFDFAKDPQAHREYFQTVPVSRLIVGQYAPLSLSEVMMPTGTLLTDAEQGDGGWHTGMMRQSIGKELISHGIDNANYGIHSTSGQGEQSHPYLVAQLAAHNNQGRYLNGIQVHGGSGGGGIVTLDHSIGNEFSHEVGHNYGLGHFVGGFKGSVHREAGQLNSAWGWDADKNRFIPNFGPFRTGKNTELEGQSQAPFDGRSYGLDAMAGGAPFSSFNRFTLYTPNSAAIIQRFLEGKAVFDPQSATGFSQWNEKTLRMEPMSHRIRLGSEEAAPIKGLSEASLTALLAAHDRVTVSMADGNWVREIPLPKAGSANEGRTVAIRHQAGYDSVLLVNGTQVKVTRGFEKSYVSDGKKWRESEGGSGETERRPVAFGVPVVTLVGYYDPDQQLRSYIYPAMHGAYGFCYPEDGNRLKPTDCQLCVDTRMGVLKFRLENRRLGGRYMNKFHVNVPAASQPTSVTLVCDGKVVDRRAVGVLTEKLEYTVNGMPLPVVSGAAGTGKPAR
ncbi:MAG: metalloprotease [Verrucomicrobiota bacterium]